MREGWGDLSCLVCQPHVGLGGVTEPTNDHHHDIKHFVFSNFLNLFRSEANLGYPSKHSVKRRILAWWGPLMSLVRDDVGHEGPGSVSSILCLLRCMLPLEADRKICHLCLQSDLVKRHTTACSHHLQKKCPMWINTLPPPSFTKVRIFVGTNLEGIRET